MDSLQKFYKFNDMHVKSKKEGHHPYLPLFLNMVDFILIYQFLSNMYRGTGYGVTNYGLVSIEKYAIWRWDELIFFLKKT